MNLLLIEDDAELCGLIREYLRGQAMNVEAEHGGMQGLAKALAGEYDLVPLDGMLPGLDSGGTRREARIIANVPGQINFVIPEEAKTGWA